ncbi:MAG: FecR domain-containing protein [Bacteroidota bacterium]
MNTLSEYHTDLITKYLSGECNPGEAKALSDWINADPENKKLFEEYSRTNSLIEAVLIEENIDPDLEWVRFTSDNSEEVQEPFRSKFFQTRYLKVAAILVLLIIPSLLLYQYLSTPQTRELVAKNKVTEGQLPDGTIVSYNSGATLSYPASFHGKKRLVTLQGEAFFKVQHINSKPFIISCGDMIIEVLGTTFYVNTNAANGKMDVILTSGSVAVYYKDDPSGRALLKPGEKAEISVNGKNMQKMQNTDANYLAWETGTLIFNGNTMSEIVPLLNKLYHTDIHLVSPETGKCRVNATFEKQSLDAILNVLKATLGLEIKQSGNRIEIIGKGCR